MSEHPLIVWFRYDSRITDNPALYHASVTKRPILCLYIDDQETLCKEYYKGGASRWWNHYALKDLENSLEKFNISLIIDQGNPLDILKKWVEKIDATTIFWNRRYFPQEIHLDKNIKSYFQGNNVEVESFKASLLVEPHCVKNKTGGAYKVYSPFRREVEAHHLDLLEPSLPKIEELKAYPNLESPFNIEDIFPLPTTPDWAGALRDKWQITEEYALKRVKEFADHALVEYKEKRDFPAQNYVSELSPYLARGMITPRTILDIVHAYPASKGKAHFISELLWREFSYYLLFHFPYMEETNFRPEWDHFKWNNDLSLLKKWQKGQTGIPMIDAAMCQLRQIGYIHNRTRMLVGSYLVKHLLIDWRYGEAWFRDNLVDFDVASNIASWQWVAGSGADAAPYFRIFNPILQSKKFDQDTDYIKQYLPIFQNVPSHLLHAPWENEKELIFYGITLGKDYPYPIVDLSKGRDAALERYQLLRKDKE